MFKVTLVVPVECHAITGLTPETMCRLVPDAQFAGVVTLMESVGPPPEPEPDPSPFTVLPFVPLTEPPAPVSATALALDNAMALADAEALDALGMGPPPLLEPQAARLKEATAAQPRTRCRSEFMNVTLGGRSVSPPGIVGQTTLRSPCPNRHPHDRRRHRGRAHRQRHFRKRHRLGYRNPKRVVSAVVNVAPMSDRDHDDEYNIVVNRVDDPVVTDSNPQTWAPLQRAGGRGSRVVRQ